MKPEWSTACPDWERRIIAGESLIPFNPLFPAQAQSGLDVFKEFRIVDLPSQPKVGEVSRPWAFDLASAIFGSYDVVTGRRLIRDIFLLISKKNTKSTLASFIMLTALCQNWRTSAEFGIIAPTIEVAGNSFKPAKDAIAADERLSTRFAVQSHTRTITDRTNGASLRVIAAENDTVGGSKFTGVLFEEIWLFGKRSNAEDLFREATGGLASRPEGFVIKVTTQSDEPPAGVLKQELDYARGVRDGDIVDPQYLPILYEYPRSYIESGEYKKPKNFYITNPNLGASVDVEFIEREHKKAEQKGEESLKGFFAKHLNVEVGLNLRSNRWAGADFWQTQSRETINLDYILQNSEVVCIGIDGGGLDDLLGLAVIGRETGTGVWLHWAHAWAHKIVLERRKDIAAQIKDFVAQGDVTLVNAPGDDVKAVAELVRSLNDAELLPREGPGIGVDAAGIGDIVDAMTAQGIRDDQIIGISQGWKLNGAIKTTERKVAGGGLMHGGQPLMAWCVGNARVEPKGNAISITKQASGSAKIDPLMATFDAASLMLLNPKAAKRDYKVHFI